MSSDIQYGQYECERCGQTASLREMDYCATCFRDLCAQCMTKGCCGFTPAKSGDAIDREAEEDSLR